MFARIFADRFVMLLLATILLASVLPVRGAVAEVASLISLAAIVLLFFLNGVRLPRHEVVNGVRNWRLQGAIFFFVFGSVFLLFFILSVVISKFVSRSGRFEIIFLV